MNSKYLNSVLTVIAVLLGLNLWVGVHQSPAAASLDPAQQAVAQGTSNAAKQRNDMIAELKTMNGKLDKVSQSLTDGSIKVSVTSMPEGD